MRYLLHESDHPISTDYYYECRKTTNDHFPRVLAHTHDYYEIYIYLSGSVMLFIEDRIYKVKRGDIISYSSLYNSSASSYFRRTAK